MKIMAIIPARGGSKGVPKKNMAILGGHPLIAYSIIASKLCPLIARTVVSTDSDEIADIARRYGAEVPFMRPSEFAQDQSTDTQVFSHAAQWLSHNEGALPDMMVQLRPTTPLRDPAQIEAAIKDLHKHRRATGLRSAHQCPEPPHKMFRLTLDGYFEGFFPDDPRPEYYNLPRQALPQAYHPNGYVDIIKTDLFIKSHSLYGAKILGFITPFTIEVDAQDDLERLEFCLKKDQNPVYAYLRKQTR